jgi:hypothetical protein
MTIQELKESIAKCKESTSKLAQENKQAKQTIKRLKNQMCSKEEEQVRNYLKRTR